MVIAFHAKKQRCRGGFVLGELSISIGIFSIVSIALLMGFTSLERSYAASSDFAINHADEMRISDYLAQDLRRATSLQPAQNDTTLYLPNYYDSSRNPRTPTLDGHGGVVYGPSGSSVRVHYYLSGGKIFRQQDDAPAVALANNVSDFVFDVTDLGKVVTTRITFRPIYKVSGASSDAITATAFYNTTLLRNNRTDISSGVY
jgi:type II secretory pathway component PulJ